MAAALLATQVAAHSAQEAELTGSLTSAIDDVSWVAICGERNVSSMLRSIPKLMLVNGFIIDA